MRLPSLCLLAGLLSLPTLATAVTTVATPTAAVAADAALPEGIAATDWPWWRGPRHDGISQGTPPVAWSDDAGIRWQVPIAGRGHGSVTVVGDQVWLATADLQTQQQAVACFDRATGKQQWNTVVHQGGLSKKGNKKASQASSTVACDGRRLFINFLNQDAIYTTALDRAGKQLWQQKITDYTVHQGYGSSPAIHGSLVIVTADNKSGGVVAGLDRDSGKVAWQHQRPKTPNYASPIILHSSGREQLLLTGCDLVAGFDPGNGKKLWEFAGSTTECVTSAVTDGKHVFTSGGYPRNHVSAIRTDGSGKVAWENKVRVYVPSMLVQDGYLYAVTDAGVAVCWKSDTGEELWKGRLGGTFSASPVMADGKIFATNEQGTTYVFKASPKKFEKIAENKLGDEVMATPTICGQHIFMRVARQQDGRRQEMLVCIGK